MVTTEARKVPPTRKNPTQMRIRKREPRPSCWTTKTHTMFSPPLAFRSWGEGGGNPVTYRQTDVEDEESHLQSADQAHVGGPADHLDLGTVYSLGSRLSANLHALACPCVRVRPHRPLSTAVLPELVLPRAGGERRALFFGHAIVRQALPMVDGEIGQCGLCCVECLGEAGRGKTPQRQAISRDVVPASAGWPPDDVSSRTAEAKVFPSRKSQKNRK
ncbi:hypothetical protein VTK73DRAFT_6284 [Phialemonium thermophilum]|uniref:Uncharacterized protein n=1 Tax=Phialemonium thermophilum TaxID=223376 RepID=A0ABR3V126_9PEZI